MEAQWESATSDRLFGALDLPPRPARSPRHVSLSIPRLPPVPFDIALTVAPRREQAGPLPEPVPAAAAEVSPVSKDNSQPREPAAHLPLITDAPSAVSDAAYFSLLHDGRDAPLALTDAEALVELTSVAMGVDGPLATFDVGAARMSARPLCRIGSLGSRATAAAVEQFAPMGTAARRLAALAERQRKENAPTMLANAHFLETAVRDAIGQLLSLHSHGGRPATLHFFMLKSEPVRRRLCFIAQMCGCDADEAAPTAAPPFAALYRIVALSDGGGDALGSVAQEWLDALLAPTLDCLGVWLFTGNVPLSSRQEFFISFNADAERCAHLTYI